MTDSPWARQEGPPGREQEVGADGAHDRGREGRRGDRRGGVSQSKNHIR